MRRIVKTALVLGTAATIMSGGICFAQDQLRTRDQQQLRLRDQSRLTTPSAAASGDQTRRMFQDRSMNQMRKSNQSRFGK